MTQTAEDAERAIRYLSDGRLGRATFLPLDTLGSRAGRERSAVPDGAGIFGWAYTLVEAQPQYAGIVAFLVGRILVVDTLDTGIELARGRGFRDTIVTLDGEEIRGGGALTGGRYQRERSILSRRAQARALSEQIPQLRAVLAQTQAAAEAAAAESTEATRERDEAHRIEAELGLARRDAASRHEVAAAERSRLDAEIASLLARSQERAAGTAEARRKLDLLERPATDPSATLAERERLEAALADARERIAGAQSAERAVASEIAAMREAVAARAAQRDGALARLGLLDADGERAAAARTAMTAELASLAERLAALDERLRADRARIGELDARQEAARRERELLEARANGLDSDLRLAQNAEREAAQKSEGGRLRLAEIDAELGMLAAQFAQNPATAEECADVEARYANERDDPAAEITRLREELARLHNVNLNAEVEIAELTERDAFLRAQLADLASARDTLLASIREIEASSQVQFNETFIAVKTAFENVYGRLFPGGEARMWQTNPEQLSETGIEISVQPPGKKMMPLTALSGGERAMAASALIFALIEVRPSPFYLLDEVDAALDDANVERFSQVVRELGKHAQLLLVTHNKKTMELAERMYGVTMSEPGISSIIAADLIALESETSKETALAG